MEPRRGPQGVSMDDLRKVTGRITRVQPTAQRMLPVSQVVSNLVGGPLPTYGKKYGGYGTFDQWNTAIIGALEPFIAARDLAAAQAEQMRSGLAAQTRFQPSSPQDYGRLRAEQARISDLLARPVSPAMPGQIARSNEMAARGTTLADLQSQLAGEPGFFTGKASQAEALREDIGQLRRNVPALPSGGLDRFIAAGLAERKAAEAAKNEAYGRQMERMNAIAFRQPTEEQKALGRELYFDPNNRDASGRMIQTFVPTVGIGDVASQRLGTPVSGRQTQELSAAQEFARQLASVSPSEIAQQLATERYGADAALAAGMFGPEFDREMMIRQLGREGVFPDQSIEEYIGMTQGPEALAAYQQDRLDAALAKQAEGFRTAEEEAYDLELERSTGINVDQAAGNRSRSVAREYLSQPNFIDYFSQARTELINNPQMSLEEQRNAAKLMAQQYAQQTGDAVAAEILLNALLSFEFALAFEPLDDTASRLRG